tara:strand:+ start:296 stop:514 length:219 start_codon:yes stop_codon:yes gene_type:complete
MNRYSLEEFKKLVENADMVYGKVSVNAAVNLPARLRKKMLLEALDQMDDKDNLGYYGRFEEDEKGRKILVLL